MTVSALDVGNEVATESDRPSGQFIAGVVVTLLVGWFIAYNFFGFRIEGVVTSTSFPPRRVIRQSGRCRCPDKHRQRPIDGTRSDAIDELVSSCTAEGGSTRGCECIANFLIENTSRDEMVFAEDPPRHRKVDLLWGRYVGAWTVRFGVRRMRRVLMQEPLSSR